MLVAWIVSITTLFDMDLKSIDHSSNRVEHVIFLVFVILELIFRFFFQNQVQEREGFI